MNTGKEPNKHISLDDIDISECYLTFDGEEIAFNYSGITEGLDQSDQSSTKLYFTDFDDMQTLFDKLIGNQTEQEQLSVYINNMLLSAKTIKQFRKELDDDEEFSILYARYIADDGESLEHDSDNDLPIIYDRNNEPISIQGIDAEVATLVSIYQLYRYIYDRTDIIKNQFISMAQKIYTEDYKTDIYIRYDSHTTIVGDKNKSTCIYCGMPLPYEMAYPEDFSFKRVDGLACEMLNKNDYRRAKFYDATDQNYLLARMALDIIAKLESDNRLKWFNFDVTEKTVMPYVYEGEKVEGSLTEEQLKARLSKLNTLGINYEKEYSSCGYAYYRYQIAEKDYLLSVYKVDELVLSNKPIE